MFPLFVDLTGRQCLVVGGGPVGRRKASSALAAGARIRLVCREPLPPGDLPAGLDWLTDEYRPAHLDGVCLAFAAASTDINRRVVADARARGVWVNSATDADRGDIYLPAAFRRSGLHVAVSTGGASPMLARRVRDILAGQCDDAIVAWVELLAELRPVIHALVIDAVRRRDVLRALAEPEWLERLRADGVGAVRCEMMAFVEAAAGL